MTNWTNVKSKSSPGYVHPFMVMVTARKTVCSCSSFDKKPGQFDLYQRSIGLGNCNQDTVRQTSEWRPHLGTMGREALNE